MKRNKVLHAGTVLLIAFCVAVSCAVIYLFIGCMGKIPGMESIIANPLSWIGQILLIILALNIIFWTGIIMVYTTSIQLGIKTRVWGIILGWIPIAHLIMLGKIIKITSDEYRFEKEKYELNESRKNDMICRTKYPILLVHGVFFRDFKHLNYWGRIPDELIKNGATIFYGEHNSAASVDNSALELEAKIKEIVEKTGCEKVNIIAHSKGGLDSRTAASKTEAGKYIASITTINTPHRGCEFADYLLTKIPIKQQNFIASTYEKAAAKLGDINPRFLEACHDLTFKNCRERNMVVKDVEGIFYQSYGAKLNSLTSGQFPLNMTYELVKYFDGPNDGLVGEKSFPWGSKYQFLTVTGKRGISHGDMIDLNRQNIPGFDVREFYVNIVSDLKNKGL